MSKQITEYQTKEKEKTIVVPAALTYDKGAPKIETKPIPSATAPKPAAPKSEQKLIPKETQILLHGLTEIEDILYAMRLQISQAYGITEQGNTEEIANCFPKDLAEKLSFERILYTEDYIIAPKGFLDKEVFNRIRDIVTDMGGSYDKPNHYFVVKRS
jgi:hypothetical protein